MTSSSEQPKEQQQREGKAYYHSDITPEVLENIQIGDWIRGIGDISCPFDQRVVQTVGTWLRMHDTRSRPHPTPPQGMTTDELWDYSNDLAEVAARKAREESQQRIKQVLMELEQALQNNNRGWITYTRDHIERAIALLQAGRT